MYEFKPGDRVMQKAEFDPLAAFAVAHGLPRAVGTVDDEQDFPGEVLVTWDKTNEDGETVPGACAPMPPYQLQLVERHG